MFCDETKITVEAGKGGDGLVSFMRRKYVPKGGPDGGDGGRGGDVVLKGNQHLNTLSNLHTKKFFQAEAGQGGGKNNKAGKGAEDLVLDVPLGTKVFDARTEQLLFDITEHDLQAVVAKGGRGGYGNAHFKGSTRQAPRFAEKGEPGEEFELRLELEMVADVGLIGVPSAGKSTLISVLSAAKPKIGDYPFTTLVPNLGVVKMQEFGGSPEQDFVVADVPGLIEGAHEGKGLGDKFLKHIKRTAVLAHVIDLAREDYIESYEIIANELLQFDPELVERSQLVVLNKADLFDEKSLKERVEKFKKHYEYLADKCLVISGATRQGIKELAFALSELVLKQRALLAEEVELDVEEDQGTVEVKKIYRPHLDDEQRVTVKYMGTREVVDRYTGENATRKIFAIAGTRFEQIVVMTDLDNDEALARVLDVMHKKRVDLQLQRLGAEAGDILQIGEVEIVWPG